MSGSLSWGISLPESERRRFFAKKITNKSNKLYYIFRASTADRCNFRILLIPAALPCA